MSEDMTYCSRDCKRKCLRNKNNIRDHSIPHSYFVERPPDCPYRKKHDDFYHVREKTNVWELTEKDAKNVSTLF